ncbi:MAG: TolC family outer membrane protein [Legionellaceae bacterium]|nr:TolC family outer membrane protein [Legionellaceae bacterium]
MQKIRVFFYIIIVLIFESSTGAAQTLREAVQQAMMLHPEILLNRAQTSSAKLGIVEAQGAYYPKFDINSAYGSEWTQSPFTQDLAGDNSTSLRRQEFNVAVVENIFSGGAIVGEVDRNVFMFKSQNYKTYSVINDIALDVAEAYIDVLLQEQLVHIAEINLSEHRRLLGLVKERSRAGVGRLAEFDQGESRYSFAESNLISAQGNQREAMVHFRKLVGSWPDNLVSPAIPSKMVLPPTAIKAVKEGFENHPRIKSASEDIKQSVAQRKISDAAFWPKIDAVFTASRNRNLDGVPGPNNDNVGLIRLSYNVFNGGGDLGHLKKTAYQVQEAIETRNRALINLKEKIQLDYNAWYASSKRVTVLANYVVSIEKTKAAYFEQFQLGQRTFLDLLNSQNEVYRSEADYLQARKDEIDARYRILNGVGRLVPFFAKQRETNKHHHELFSLPETTKKPLKIVTQQPAAYNRLNGQLIYPSGNTTISSTTPLPNAPPQIPAPDALSLMASPDSVITSPAPGANNAVPQSSVATPVYLVDLSGFKNEQEVEDLTTSLQNQGLEAKIEIERSNKLQIEHVVIGPFHESSEATKVLNSIPNKQILGIIRRVTLQYNSSETLRK